MTVITVSQLNRYVKAVLEEDKNLRDLYVRGEISNFTRHFSSGHFYFSLKDDKSALRAVMFRSYAQELAFLPENGMAMLARGHVGGYERDGAYQFYVTDMQPDGIGALSVAFEQRKAKLAALGLFEESRKKPLPAYPRRIGVVTSKTGAALQDIQTVLARRYPLATLVLCPAVVQGESAGSSVAAAVRALDGNCDVMIVGRGGGSLEDLWGFNDETLAWAVFECKTPVVSAVGHETDFTICDFVADVRAPTPSAAAELVSPSAEQLARRLGATAERLARQSGEMLLGWENRLNSLRERPVLRSPMGAIQKSKEKLDFFSESLYNKKCIFIQRLEQAYESKTALLDSLSPLRVLDRGYALALRGGSAVRSVGALSPGDAVTLRFRDGKAEVSVLEVIKEDDDEKNSYI